MPTLYVENVPEDLYEALRHRARQNRKSISSEVLSLLEQNVVTAAEQQSRREFLRDAQRLRAQRSTSKRKFQPIEESQREDRLR
jgi:plasmid stability protein